MLVSRSVSRALAALALACPALAQGDASVARTENPVMFHPIPGFTTALHTAPRDLCVPTGVPVTFEFDGLAPGERVEWRADGAGGDGATFVVSAERECTLSATVLPSGQEFRTRLFPADVSPDSLAFTPALEPATPFRLSEDATNDETVAAWHGPSIAGVHTTPGGFATSVYTKLVLDVSADTTPGLSGLVEWRLDGQALGVGGSTWKPLVTGRHVLEVGPPAVEREVELVAYKVEISGAYPATSLPDEEELVFSATTQPPGYEDKVRWLAATKYGGAEPTLGYGRTFRTTFRGTSPSPGTGLRWLGVRCDHAVVGADGPPAPEDAGMPALNVPFCVDPFGFGTACGTPSADDGITLSQDHGEAILPHNGQEVRDETDLFFRGLDAPTNVKIARRHRTRVDAGNSIFGPAWSFNYRQRFVQIDEGNLEMESFGRTDVFTSQGSNVWHGGRGRFHRLVYDPNASTATMRMRSGTQVEFATQGEPENENLVGLMTKILSPNGNTIEFTYDAAPSLLDRKVMQITDSYKRPITFSYYGAGDPFPGGCRTITDWSGREVLYTYNSAGQLTSVRSPLVQTTGAPGNDFPNGKLTTYGYDPTVTNALASITFPKENAAGSNAPRLAWTYYDDPAAQFFGYVHTHSVGNTGLPANQAAGGVYTYAYDLVGPGTGVNQPYILTTLTDRRGTETEITSNFYGHVLREEVFTRGLRSHEPDPEPTSRFRDYVYNADGDLLSSTGWSAVIGPGVEALGVGSTRMIADSPVRTQQANETVRDTDPLPSPPAPHTITRSVVYEPIFNKPFKITDPRGHTTTYLLDYFEDLQGAALKFAPELGVEVADLQAMFMTATITDHPLVNTNINGDLWGPNAQNPDAQLCGNVIRVEHPQVTLPPEADLHFGLGAAQNAVEVFWFNEFGQVIREVDAELNVNEYEYFGENNVDGDNIVEVQDGATDAGGYVKTLIRDTMLATGRNSGVNSPPAVETTRFEYTFQEPGFKKNRHGVPTAIVDPRGIKSIFMVNELDQVVREVRARTITPHATETGLMPLAYEAITLYDANNNVIETRTQNKDDLDGSNDFIVTTFDYDVLDQLRLKVEDAGSGLSEITMEYEYDANQNLVRLTRGLGSDVETSDTWSFDERDILVRHTRGATRQSPLPADRNAGVVDAAFEVRIDAFGNITTRVDADGDHETSFEFDVFHRRSAVTDRVGTRTSWEYDEASNVISESTVGAKNDLDPASVELARTETVYDERNRPVRVLRHVAQPDQFFAGFRSHELTTVTVYDRLGRVVGLVDEEGDDFETQFDGLGRIIRSIDPGANEIVNAYDANGNLTSALERETSTGTAYDEFPSLFTFDALNRQTSVTEPNGQVTIFDHDSRDNVVRQVDAEGNTVELRYDRLDRLVETRRLLDSAPVGEGGGDDVITIGQAWDELHRIVSRTTDSGPSVASGGTQTFDYDDLDRLVGTDYLPGPFQTETWTYNKDGEILLHTDRNQTVAEWSYDAESRRTGVTYTNATTTIAGTKTKEWAYDGLGRLTRSLDENEPSDPEDDVECRYVYDTLGRVLRERQTIGSQPSLDVDTAWSGAVHRAVQTYPNGRVVRRSYDALDRLQRIDEGPGPLQDLIAEFEYIGPTRDLVVTYGNGTSLNKMNGGYDDNRRHVRHEWRTLGNGLITAYANSYNAVNRRTSETREHFLLPWSLQLGNRTDTYTFDDAYRMVAFTPDYAAPQSTRTLDGADKMVAFIDEGAAKNPLVSADGLQRYDSFGGGGTTNRSYDGNANLSQDGASGQAYCWDANNRLVRSGNGAACDTAGTYVKYVYAADNRRVYRAEMAGGVEQSGTRYLYDGWQVVEERDGANTLLRQFVTGRSLDDHIQLKQAGGAEYYYHCNSQGFVGALTDDSGNVVETYEYSWLGRPVIRTAVCDPCPDSLFGNPYMFQGRRYDADTGLYYFRNRYYDPRTGEFLSFDPLGMWNHGQGNGYSAFDEDGWNNADPMGLRTQCELFGQFYHRNVNNLGNWQADLDDLLMELSEGGCPSPEMLERISTLVNNIETTKRSHAKVTKGYAACLKKEGKELRATAAAWRRAEVGTRIVIELGNVAGGTAMILVPATGLYGQVEGRAKITGGAANLTAIIVSEVRGQDSTKLKPVPTSVTGGAAKVATTLGADKETVETIKLVADSALNAKDLAEAIGKKATLGIVSNTLGQANTIQSAVD